MPRFRGVWAGGLIFLGSEDACPGCPHPDILSARMFTNFLQEHKPTVTVVIFVGTFLVTLAIGRLLKQRAGVRLGVLFRLLCFVLAFYAAASFYGLNVSWRTHVDAAAIWLGTAFIVALLDRY